MLLFAIKLLPAAVYCRTNDTQRLRATEQIAGGVVDCCRASTSRLWGAAR